MKMPVWRALSVSLILAVAACDQLTEVSTTHLAQIVARDGVSFDGQSIPEQVLQRLAPHKVVVVGEVHHLREHYELMAEVIQALHAWGFRQVLLEWPQAADWLLKDFVMGGQLEPEWRPPPELGGSIIEAVRDFNGLLQADERILVRGIDVNLSDYGGSEMFVDLLRSLAGHLPSPGPIDAFLRLSNGDVSTAEEHMERVDALRDDIRSHRGDLIEAWGESWYDTVAEMVEVEVASIGVRGIRGDHYDMSVRLRESVMKRLADLRIEDCGCGTVMNMGANHAQKESFRGTSQEWLGDYLVHESGVVGGSAFVLGVFPARGDPGTGGSIADYDILDESPENEILRLINETWPEQIAFLPLDDPIFVEGGVPMNVEGTIDVIPVKEQYDALVLLPLVHFVGP